ncbi:hypothetical protein [Streptomyces sp. NPDC017890]|uniref:hypothetical protein n=1 Tax=Streptomyces sp. NPDC017890 TaxID=3365015 RepID=UPI0037B5BCC1
MDEIRTGEVIDPRTLERSQVSEFPTPAHYFCSTTGHGLFSRRFNTAGVKPNHFCLATMSEVDSRFVPVFGDAVLTVHNVTPLTDQVLIRAETTGSTDLRLMIWFYIW